MIFCNQVTWAIISALKGILMITLQSWTSDLRRWINLSFSVLSYGIYYCKSVMAPNGAWMFIHAMSLSIDHHWCKALSQHQVTCGCEHDGWSCRAGSKDVWLRHVWQPRHHSCSQRYVCAHFTYLPLLICRGEWRRWSDGSGLSGERDRLPRPWDRLEWSDVSECISEMSTTYKWIGINICSRHLVIGQIKTEKKNLVWNYSSWCLYFVSHSMWSQMHGSNIAMLQVCCLTISVRIVGWRDTVVKVWNAE